MKTKRKGEKKPVWELLYPPTGLLVAMVPVCILLLARSSMDHDPWDLFSLGTYLLCLYTLAALLARVPRAFGYLRRVKKNNEQVNHLGDDVRLKVKLSLYLSVLTNSGYATLQLGMGLWHRSMWFYSFSVYYALLTLMRFLLLRDVRHLRPGEDRISELKRSRLCGILLLITMPALMSIVIFMTQYGREITHHPITTVALSAYTLGALIFAVIKLIRYRRFRSPMLISTKLVSLVAASVSLLTLESALFRVFLEGISDDIKYGITLFSGVVVCSLVTAVGIYMIGHSTGELRRSETP